MKSEFTVSCHQPNFIPYLGFFDKMARSELFVVRDEVLFVKKEYHNRNRIRINSHDPNVPMSKWVGVPVENDGDFIKHVTIKRETKIKGRYWNEVLLKEIKTSYSKAPFFEEHFAKFEEIFDNSHDKLLDLNMKIIKLLAKSFEIKTKIILASELNLKGEKYEKSDASEDLANICSAVGANVYLSGSGGKEYLYKKPFEEKGIRVEFQDYNHPVYPVPYNQFLPYMSSMEALFCCNSLPKHVENRIEIPLIVKR